MKYPIGIQDFREIRTDGYVYVDKTQHIHRVLDSGKYFFLSRPRRFGKSLLLATMNELYCGSKELFEGLWVYDKWDWEANKRPVVWLKFASQGMKSMGLVPGIHHMLDAEAARLGVILEAVDYSQKFKQLLQLVSLKYDRKVVLLVDEHDKPIIDFLDDVPQAETNRDVLKSFYSILKDSDALLEKIFITGVSAFSRVSIFSDLNHLTNLTIKQVAHTLLGITQAELQRYFTSTLQSIANKRKLTLEEISDQTARWYNGYSWGGEERVYNPFSLLSFLNSGEFHNFWFETGTPTFLVKEMKKQHYYNVQRTRTTENRLTAFDVAQLNPITVLFQTGYLTIVEYVPEDRLYTLDYPNMEVRQSLEQNLLSDYLNFPLEDPQVRVVNLRDALRHQDLNEVFEILNATLAGIPYDLWHKEDEHFFHALIHLTFSLLGTYIRSEVHTARGRCDALVETADHIYAFEFKLDKSAAEALQQIHDKGYLAPYADSHKKIIAVGANFSSETKQIEGWLVEQQA
ncbi:MAG TPA: AAA family ATPase [Saprospiraceae bacterium]|nr:AAA family ATPase [Saprospiraceae bacterium]HMQ83479.1 AAA family ATPase [Saprospiraceae bacterium]